MLLTYTLAVAAAALGSNNTNRTMPAGDWTYEWARFPAAWFGANWTGFENEQQLALFGKYSLVMFGWQAMQGLVKTRPAGLF